MTKADIISGFLGAGKTTLIKKLISEAYPGEKLVLIENEFGDVSVDGGFMADSGIEVTEMNSGCICCSLVGDFEKALTEVIERFSPDRVLIEPSGVGKLSDILSAARRVPGLEVSAAITVVDAKKCKMYSRNFGEFYGDQIKNAGAIVLSRTDEITEEKLRECIGILRQYSENAPIVTTPWDKLSGRDILETALTGGSLKERLEELGHRHRHEHHHHDEHCSCTHHHEHHHHNENCSCAHHHGHDHHEHHHHDADEVFASWGVETAKKYSKAELSAMLDALSSEKYGTVLRAKGIVDGSEGAFLHFDYVPGESSLREGTAAVTGVICVIGARLEKTALEVLFGV